MDQQLASLTHSLEMAAAEIKKAAIQQGVKQQQASPGGSPSPAQLQAGSPPPKPRAASAGRIRPAGAKHPTDALHITTASVPQPNGLKPHLQSQQQQHSALGPALRGSTDKQGGALGRQHQQQPVGLHSSILNTAPQQQRPASKSDAGSVAGSAASSPSLAATLGRIHRQLADTSLPFKRNDAQDPTAWMMHNPKHSILQTQAKLNKLSRLERAHPARGVQQEPLHRVQQLSNGHGAQNQQQSLLLRGMQSPAPTPAGSAACVRRPAGDGNGVLGGGQGLPQRPSPLVQQFGRPPLGQGPGNQQGPGTTWVPPTESALKQLPLMPKPWNYRPTPSYADSHADWWRSRGSRTGSRAGSVMSYPVTAVTDRESVTPSELAAWESRMSNLEASIQEEKDRRKRFEEELRQLEAFAKSRGAISTGGIAVANFPTAGQQQRRLKS